MLPLVDNPLVQTTFWSGFLLLAAWFSYRLKTFINKHWRRQPGLIDLINQELPQTQCGQCGHPGCLPYARAISQGEAINKCPPGGENTIRRLARLLNETAESLDPAHGTFTPPAVASIREAECIGCTKCIQACPVDAILGAAKLMHTVIVAECTGCDLCVAPCPVDCIDIIPVVMPSSAWSQP